MCVCVCVNARVALSPINLSILFFDFKLPVDLGQAKAQAHLVVSVVSTRSITFVFKTRVTCWIVLRYCFGSDLLGIHYFVGTVKSVSVMFVLVYI